MVAVGRLELPTGNLPEEAKQIFEQVYQKAKANCPEGRDCEEYAAKIAWSAVKKAGWHKNEDGSWTKRAEVQEFSLVITKASYDKATGRKSWRAVTSDTDEDLYNDNMSLELYNDFLRRIELKEKPPGRHCNEYWCGGTPYLSIAHYPDFKGRGVPGKVEKVYIDGNKLKAVGTFDDTPLGEACFRSICEDLYSEKRSFENKVRVSIAFIDWKHEHKRTGKVFERKSISEVCPHCLEDALLGDGLGDGGRRFLAGQLIHFALTRVPVNERTGWEVSIMTTMKEDAASIVGDEMSQELDELSRAEVEVDKSLVIKGDAVVDDHDTGIECEDGDKECVEKQEAARMKEMMNKSDAIAERIVGLSKDINEIKSTLIEIRKSMERPAHPLDAQFDILRSVYDDARIKEDKDAALREVQEPFDELGKIIVDGIRSSSGREDEQVTKNIASAIEAAVAPLREQVGLLLSQVQSSQSTVSGAPPRRSIDPAVLKAQSQASQSKTPKLRALVERSVGLG